MATMLPFRNQINTINTMVIAFVLYFTSKSNGYYLCLSALHWHNASNYCQLHCQSELASIHSYEAHQKIIALINDKIEYLPTYKHVWIGLHQSSSNPTTFEWTDHTTFDYGNVTQGVYPWKQSNPDGKECVHLDYDAGGFTFNDRECTVRRPFLCNDCDGVLTKYVLPGDYLTHVPAQNMCKNVYGTHLLSIHNPTDQETAELLCQQSSDSSCLIGLYDTDFNRNYSWDDGTTFDYGRKLDGNIPWRAGEFYDASSGQCVALDETVYRWKDAECNRGVRQFICNMPSELCYQSQWNSTGPSELEWESDSCSAILNGLAIIGNKQWLNMHHSQRLTVEIMFAITDNVSEECIGAGIVIYNGGCDDYRYISLNVDNTLRFEYNGQLVQDTVPFNFTYDTFYSLKIERSNGNQYKFYVNGVLYVSLLEHDKVLINSSLSGHVGIRTSINCKVIIQSLFVSGVEIYDTDNDWYGSCDELPPTVEPTSDPTIDALLWHINYGVYFQISFDYALNSSMSTPINLHIIRELLQNITLDIVHEHTHCIDFEQCIAGWNNTVTIKATIFVCNQEEQVRLVAMIEQTLSTELLEKMQKDCAMLTVDVPSLQIDFDTIQERGHKIETTFYTTKQQTSTEPFDTKENNEANDIFRFIIIIAIIGASITVLILIVSCSCHIFSRNKKLEIVEMMPISSVSSKNTTVNSDKTESNKVHTIKGVTTPNGNDSQNIRSDPESGIDEIKQWLDDTVKLSQYYNHFIDNGYESLQFIKEITEESELFEIGIESETHQKIIMSEIKKFQTVIDDGNEILDETEGLTAETKTSTTKGNNDHEFIVVGDESDTIQ